MPGIVTTKFRLNNAKQFYEAFSESEPTQLYFFIAKSLAWSNESSPDSVTDSVKTVEYSIWDEMMSMKKINASNVSYVAPRYDWTTGTVYAKYDDISGTMYSNNYFVFTEDYNVYKCLSNNNGASSTVKPTGTSNTTIITSDGYLWKYMYTVSAAKALSFLTSNYIPVQTLESDDTSIQWDVQSTAANGSIEYSHVTSGGTGYKGHSGTAQTANSTTITLASGASSNNNEYANNNIYISGGTGSGQLKRITAYNGTTKVATVDSVWSPTPSGTVTYITGPKLTFNGDGSNAKGYSTVSGGAIATTVMINKGSNYSYANCTVTALNGSGASIRPIISPPGGHGKNAVEELNAYNVMLNVKLIGSEEGTFTTNNEFRTLGIIADPVLSSNGAIATASSYNLCTRLTVGSVTGAYTKDEKVTGGTSGATGYVVDFLNGNTLRLNKVKGTFATSEVVTGATSSATSTISSKTNSPIKKFSGEVLYIENRSPITRSADQQEDLRIIIKF